MIHIYIFIKIITLFLLLSHFRTFANYSTIPSVIKMILKRDREQYPPNDKKIPILADIPLKITLILRFNERINESLQHDIQGLELEKGMILSNRWRMLPAFPSTRAPAPAASSPRRRRSDFSRTRAPASATDWG